MEQIRVKLSDLRDGEAVRAEGGPYGICLARVGEDIYALADRCSHQNWPLSDGEVETFSCSIECTKHGSTCLLYTSYSTTAGSCLSASHCQSSSLVSPCATWTEGLWGATGGRGTSERGIALELTVSRTSDPLGSLGAKVTDSAEAASGLAADGTPVVLVGEDAAVLGEALATAPDRDAHERLLGVMVGDPSGAATAAAAAEMAGELWAWARTARDATEQVG